MDPYEGFREFVLARGPALSRAAYLLTGNRTQAEELVQAALVKAAVRWRRLSTGGNPEAYVRKIMVNDHISWWRRFARRELPETSAREQAVHDQSDRTAQRIDLAAALAKLPARQRAVIVLRFYQDLSEAETAAAMGCAVGTVKSQTSDALAKLRRLIHTGADETVEVGK
ncbi:DNA-directed RNA polymerase sigma-70 factor [Rhizocola hellebori]|uniref:DNA-directed RNA polymerase sigma-70 factor n=1 Tax=Rhizocola hellebori TaxID=1392758 RepID=A0A8J3QCM2_9ACTN|nr:SigE family RNA polymerase sigma factor [Rhizocola hellebori]GIH06996.1 DNA-directed RNA polymerase sigma-70 factor [Rhizocola hellebori]